jgi:hypothetical protein
LLRSQAFPGLALEPGETPALLAAADRLGERRQETEAVHAAATSTEGAAVHGSPPLRRAAPRHGGHRTAALPLQPAGRRAQPEGAAQVVHQDAEAAGGSVEEDVPRARGCGGAGRAVDMVNPP